MGMQKAFDMRKDSLDASFNFLDHAIDNDRGFPADFDKPLSCFDLNRLLLAIDATGSGRRCIRL